jgi:HEPN domain-containing protein
MGTHLHTGRADQHKASVARRVDAERLRAAQRWRGAMYLMGYALECSLKARLMERHDVRHLDDLAERLSRRFGKPVDPKKHSLAYLFELTEANARLSGAARRAYNACVRWRVDWRYDPHGGTREDCDAFFECAARFLRFVESSV